VLHHFGADHNVANRVPGVKCAGGANRDDATRFECACGGNRSCGGNLPHAAAEKGNRRPVNRSNEESTSADPRERVLRKSRCERFKGGALCTEGGDDQDWGIGGHLDRNISL
jgi:hypothetical protein